MISKIKFFAHFINRPVIGKIWLQPFFEALYSYALAGMYIGKGGDVCQSGEINAIKRAKIVAQRSSKPIVFFDVGANIGHYTEILADVLKDTQANIHSFEPAKKTFSLLRENTKSLSRVSLHNIGLGDTDSSMPLFYTEEGSGMASVYKRRLDHHNDYMKLSEDVKMRSLDSFCKEMNIGHIHLLKIDAEGHDLNVLKGAKEMIARKAIDFIQFEFSGCNIDSRTFFQDFWYLLHDEYDMYRVVKNGLYPVRQYKESYEIFITTNYVAIRKGVEKE